MPVGLLALAVTSAVLPPSPERRGARVDYRGAALLTAAITCVVLVTTWGGTEFRPLRRCPRRLVLVMVPLCATAVVLALQLRERPLRSGVRAEPVPELV